MTTPMPTQPAANSMLIVHGNWDDKPSFRLIPVCLASAPFIEAIYMPEDKALAIVSPQHKPGIAMLARLDDLGQPKPMPGRHVKPGDVQLQRVAVDKYYEYHITDENDIRTLVEMVAQNPEHQAYRDVFPVEQVNTETFDPTPGTSHPEA